MSEMDPQLQRTSYAPEWLGHYGSGEARRKIAARQNYYLCLGWHRRGEVPYDLEEKTATGLQMAGLSSEDVLMDIGCGYPGFGFQLAETGHTGFIFCVEPNTAQFDLLPYWQAIDKPEFTVEDKLKDWHDLAQKVWRPASERHPNLILQEAMAGRIPLEDNSVDAITSMFMFYHVDKAQQSQTLNELKRTLKPGGLFALTTRGQNNKRNLCSEEALIAQALTKILGEPVSQPAPTSSGFTSEDAALLLPKHFAHVYQLHHSDDIIIDDKWSVDIVLGNHWSLRDLYLTANKRPPQSTHFYMALKQSVYARLDQIRQGRHMMHDIWDESLFICSDRALDLPARFTELK